MTFDYRECCNDIAQAMEPVVKKYSTYIQPHVLQRLADGEITAQDALNTIIDPAIDLAIAEERKRYFHDDA